ncbi:MAG: flippase [Methanobacterium sp.]|jgi:O-antigen/teichoic acid export membrane protein
MNTVQRIAKNTGILFSAQIIACILGFFYSIYMARYLGPVGFGVLSFAIALILIFGVLGDLGLSTLLTRELSKDKSLEKKFIGNFLPIKIILSILTYSLLVLFVNLLGYSHQTLNIVYIIGLSMVANGFSQLFYGLFQSYEKMEYQSITLLINNMLIFLGVIYGISHGFNVSWFAFIYFIASLAVLIFSLTIFIWKYDSFNLEFHFSYWKKSLILALPLSILLIFSVIASRVDTILLELLKGSTAVGYYSASYRILDSLMYIPTLYTGAIFPVLSNFHVSSKESLIILYEKSFKYLFIISLPIAAAITILAQHIILILYQNSYYQSILCLQILIWSIPFLFLMSMFGTMFVSIKKAYIMVKITLFSMIFNITLNLIFIPTYSYIGAAILTVLTGILGCLISFYYLSQFIYEIRIKRIVLKPILSTIIVSLLLLLVHINFFLLIVIATILYLGLIRVFKTFTKDDYDIFIKLVPNFIKIYLIKMYNFYILIF